MTSDNGMTHALWAGTGRSRWDLAAPLALALQIRSAWLLLGVWVLSGAAAPHPVLGRVRMLPAHPDWVLPALVQSAVAAVTVVGLARRWRPGWVVATAATVSGAAWAATFARVPNGLSGFLLVVQPVQEVLTMAILLACVAVSWRRLGRWAAVPAVALVGGVGVGALRLLLSNSVLADPWPEGWQGELTHEVIGAALLAVVVAVLRGRTSAAQGDPAGTPAWRSGAALGSVGLLALTAAHLAAGSAFSGWTMADSRRLLIAAGVLAALSAWALVSSGRSPQPDPE